MLKREEGERRSNRIKLAPIKKKFLVPALVNRVWQKEPKVLVGWTSSRLALLFLKEKHRFL